MMGGYFIEYKQGGTNYRTELYLSYNLALLKYKTLDLLKTDVGITDIKMIKLEF